MNEQLITALALAAGLAAGAAIAWAILRGRIEAARAEGRALADVELATWQERLRAADTARQLQEGALAEAQAVTAALRAELAELRAGNASLATRLAEQGRQGEEKLALLTDARETLSQQFRVLANEILEEKSKRFTEQNQQNLGQLLDPLRQRIGEFQAKVEDVYVKEGKDRSALAEQVRQLMDLNQSLAREAKDLTQALKGSSKTQGNWGELVLERVLEGSGLRKGEEYEVQESHTREDGSRAQPDVVIHLPEDRHLVVDAKVTLTAYEEYASADDDAAREIALRRHIDSVKSHIRGLAERNYQDLYTLRSLDFVLMFIPIEPAFMLAVTHDRELFMHAWQKNVLLVSPSTLLFVVRTVAHLWRQEAQSRNALEIAKRGAELYDKLVGFVEALDGVGTKLGQAQKEFDNAHKRLVGKGGAVRQAEMLKDLGVKPSKALPRSTLEAIDEDEVSPPAT